jgi:predicted enzyme involved in methoxymalonyl-ACP biosynthesis
MRFEEALRIVSRRTGGKTRTVHLLCGFVPLHLETFLKAHLALRFPEQNIALKTGLFGDLEGNISQAAAEGAEGSVVILEWSDLDQRLGFRTSSGWSAQTLSDIVLQVEEKLRRLEAGLILLASHLPLALAPPTIGLPPFSYLPPSQAGDSELQLNALLAGFLHRLASHEGVRIVSAALLAVTSPQSARHDTKMDLRAGFPYTVTHADALAELSARCLFPASPKKGLITDLDRTLWKGILGDAGVEGISWSLEGKSQAHALYQQVLASLAESGLLVAIASKNDPAFVEAALRRPDLLIDPARIFPIEAGWGP